MKSLVQCLNASQKMDMLIYEGQEFLFKSSIDYDGIKIVFITDNDFYWKYDIENTIRPQLLSCYNKSFFSELVDKALI